jgi:hypothetical protein
MGINIKDLIKKEEKYTSKANKIIKQKDSLYSRLESASTLEEKAKIEENISKLDTQFANVMGALNDTRINIDREMISKVSKPRKDKSKFKSTRQKSKSSKVYKRSRKNTVNDYDETFSNKTYNYQSKDEHTQKVKPKSSIYESRAREESKAQKEEPISILEKILKVLVGDSKEEKKDRKKLSKLSKIKKRIGSKASSGMSAFSGYMDTAMLGLGGLAMYPQLKEMFFEGATDRKGDAIKPEKTPGLDKLSKFIPDYLKYDEHMKWAEGHDKGKQFKKSPHLSKIEGMDVKGEDKYISKKFAESKEYKALKRFVGEHKSYITAGFDIKSKRSPHKKDSSHYKGIKVDLGTRQITEKWGKTKEEKELVLKEMAKFIIQLGKSGATQIIFEYGDSTPMDFVKALEEYIPSFKKHGVNFQIIKTAGTGEHLDVKYDEKYALKKEEISQISKASLNDGIQEASKETGIFGALGVDFQKTKKILEDKFKTVRDRLVRGESIKDTMMDFKLQPGSAQKTKSAEDTNTILKSHLEGTGINSDNMGSPMATGSKGLKNTTLKHVRDYMQKSSNPDAIQELKKEEEQLKEEKRSAEAKMQGQQPAVVMSSNDNNSTTINNINGENKFGYIYDSESDLLLF